MNIRIFWVCVMQCMCAQTNLGLYSHWKEFCRNGVSTHVNSKGKSHLLEKFSPEEDWTHDTASSRTASPTHTTKELFQPHTEEAVMKNVVDHLNSFWGRNSSLVVFGLAVHSVAGWILLWGHFPVEGIFLLELTWVQTPFPKSSFGWEYKPRSSLCTHAFHRTDSKDPDVHVLDRWMPATKTHPARTVHEDGMWLP